MQGLTPSDACIKLAKSFEGCRLTSYEDASGKLTIGYGHTGSDVIVDQTITQAEAETLLMSDLLNASKEVNRLVTITLLQSEFDALCDFVFNLGGHTLENSKILVWLNAGQFDHVEADFLLFDKDEKGDVLPGLQARRVAERDMFIGGVA